MTLLNKAIAISLFISATSFAQQLTGIWDASVVVNEVKIPFRFEISAAGESASGAFFNGDERVRSTSGTYQDGVLTLKWDHYAGKLTAKLADGKLAGNYQRAKANYVFEAVPHVEKQSAADGATPSISGAWNIITKSSKGEAAWRFVANQTGSAVTAAILRVDGDTGTLNGRWENGKLVLSHFSGARPALFEITPNADGTLNVLQNGKTQLSAVRASEAKAKGLPEPADASTWTTVRDPKEPFHFSGKDLTGAVITDADPRFQGKVVIVNLGGSWCPNCHDEAPFLAELYRAYKSKGLEVVTLSFEEADQLANPVRLRAFIKQYGIEYTILLGGETGEVHEKLPQAVNLNTWPATFILGRDGLVKAVHAGFASRALGEAHYQLKNEFTHTVEKLLAEKPATTQSRVSSGGN